MYTNMKPQPSSLEPPSITTSKSIQRASIALEDLRIILNLPTRVRVGLETHTAPELRLNVLAHSGVVTRQVMRHIR